MDFFNKVKTRVVEYRYADGNIGYKPQYKMWYNLTWQDVVYTQDYGYATVNFHEWTKTIDGANGILEKYLFPELPGDTVVSKRVVCETVY